MFLVCCRRRSEPPNKNPTPKPPEEEYKEDRKDKRTKIQASQQSELIDQRKSGKPPKDFESAGFDSLGGFGLEQFDPR